VNWWLGDIDDVYGEGDLIVVSGQWGHAVGVFDDGVTEVVAVVTGRNAAVKWVVTEAMDDPGVTVDVIFGDLVVPAMFTGCDGGVVNKGDGGLVVVGAVGNVLDGVMGDGVDDGPSGNVRGNVAHGVVPSGSVVWMYENPTTIGGVTQLTWCLVVSIENDPP